MAAIPKWGNLQYHRTLVRQPDEGLIGLDWYKWQDCAKRLPATAPVLLVMHGITGTLYSFPPAVRITKQGRPSR